MRKFIVTEKQMRDAVRYGLELNIQEQRIVDILIHDIEDEIETVLYGDCDELDFVQPHKKMSVNLDLPPVTPTESENLNKWTPVSERLPEENGRYFVTVKLGYVTTAIWAGITEDWDKVTAWMPFFPKPYKASPTSEEVTDNE